LFDRHPSRHLFPFEDQLITVYRLSLRSEASLLDETHSNRHRIAARSVSSWKRAPSRRREPAGLRRLLLLCVLRAGVGGLGGAAHHALHDRAEQGPSARAPGIDGTCAAPRLVAQRFSVVARLKPWSLMNTRRIVLVWIVGSVCRSPGTAGRRISAVCAVLIVVNFFAVQHDNARADSDRQPGILDGIALISAVCARCRSIRGTF
jgi:hypothetical protein